MTLGFDRIQSVLNLIIMVSVECWGLRPDWRRLKGESEIRK